jgi:hypothetical protein
VPLKTLAQAEVLAEVIRRESDAVLLTGYRHDEHEGVYAIELVDLATGRPFLVWSAADWRARRPAPMRASIQDDGEEAS